MHASTDVYRAVLEHTDRLHLTTPMPFLPLRLIVPILAIAIPLSAAGKQPPRASDCSKASSLAEKKICASPRLRGLDARIAQAYRRALALQDAKDAKALQTDQQWFILVRDNHAELDDANEADSRLAEDLGERAVLLESLVRPPATGVAGHWVNLTGEASIVIEKGGMHLSAETHEMQSARWICDAEGWARPARNAGRVRFKAGQARYLAGRNGSTLELSPEGGEDHQDCGTGGSLDGTFFAARPERAHR